METFKLASRLKLRFATTQGSLSTEQLWDLKVEQLDEMAVALEKEYQESGKKSFLVKRSTKDKTTKLKFDIVLDILNTKTEEAEALREAADVKEHNEKIMGLIAKKEEEGLGQKSIAELKKAYEIMKKVVVLDSMTNEVHVFTLPVEYYNNPKAFVLQQFSQDGQTFSEAWVDFMVVDLSETEGRLPIYIH